MDRSSRIGLAVFLSALAALALAPYWAGRQDLRLLAEIYAYVALASAWNLLAGYAGLVSVGQHAYVGLGGYLLFALTMFAGVSPLWAVPLVGILAAAVSIPVAALVFRLRGHYFASSPRRCRRWAAAPAPACLPALSSPLRRPARCANSSSIGRRLLSRCWFSG
jgi:ABC-type branched-subunit amino acid transport system permease subunit